MFATVRYLKVEKSYRDENIRRVHDELLPEIQAIPGFIDYYLVYTDNETEVSIGVFKDKKGADQLNALAGQFIKNKPSVKLTTVHEGPVVVRSRMPAVV